MNALFKQFTEQPIGYACEQVCGDVLEEIEKVFGRGSDFNITYEDLNKLEYIEAVIKEGR